MQILVDEVIASAAKYHGDFIKILVTKNKYHDTDGLFVEEFVKFISFQVVSTKYKTN
ncbi:hypothetical protein PPL_07156 [Heterostelium album PN500]|uniref:Uncharacterized protein n=1 Tax=Heterostelium pallidum (strain ATCC 26659 / Pp 5 / PN500) TaxID=670386 RepID=D3BEJ4_HETP5|nr:hypothetical protein PPL_07156 [Heterostelium album PN500]EFA80325.1 hypothetical protein PPL_07156 [Heterostelium album PN500]|eukprot:XP_020432445.1 hypothetical protein PPL_07156 [Heterostelium album PN500]